MILVIAVSVYLILMNFIAIMADSCMYYASITALVTTDGSFHGKRRRFLYRGKHQRNLPW